MVSGLLGWLRGGDDCDDEDDRPLSEEELYRIGVRWGASPEVAREYAHNAFTDGATYSSACSGVYQERDGQYYNPFE
jgi:hypothetical protein